MRPSFNRKQVGSAQAELADVRDRGGGSNTASAGAPGTNRTATQILLGLFLVRLAGGAPRPERKEG